MDQKDDMRTTPPINTGKEPTSAAKIWKRVQHQARPLIKTMGDLGVAGEVAELAPLRPLV